MKLSWIERAPRPEGPIARPPKEPDAKVSDDYWGLEYLAYCGIGYYEGQPCLLAVLDGTAEVYLAPLGADYEDWMTGRRWTVTANP